MSRFAPLVFVAAVAVTVGAACSSSGSASGRTITITQSDDGCTPDTIDVRPKESVTFEVKNAGKKDHEVEGVEGMKLEELLVPSGRSRTIGYTAPASAGTQKIKCYIPAGSTTIIQVNVSGPTTKAGNGSDAEQVSARSFKTDRQANVTVAVKLDSFTITPDRNSVPAGPIRFSVANVSRTDVHELAVLKVNGEDMQMAGEIDDIEPGKSGDLVLDLPAGDYMLACLIAPGEYGSTVGHYAEGMKTPFTVTG